jgi:uncharacterized protein YjbI with pentapeptide repeats
LCLRIAKPPPQQLPAVRWRVVHLINANFTAADLTGADLRGAKIAGSNFTRAKIDGIVLDEDIKLSIKR